MSVLFILYAFSCFCLTFSRIALYLIQNISYNAVIVRRVSWLSGWLFAVIFFSFKIKGKQLLLLLRDRIIAFLLHAVASCSTTREPVSLAA